jgi:hypothetical protein
MGPVVQNWISANLGLDLACEQVLVKIKPVLLVCVFLHFFLLQNVRKENAN